MKKNKLLKLISGITALSLLSLPMAVPAMAEDEDQKEMVYVLANDDGSVDRVIVSEHLYNRAGDNVLNDYSVLSDIENLSGDEGFTRSGNDIQWAANGAEIRYEGTTDAPLPVGMQITYTLDGREVAPEALEGASGHLVIAIDYIANATRTVTIDGSAMEMPLPFLMATVLLADPDVYSNVSVTNGKLIDMGKNLIVVCYGLPGLSEALNTDSIDAFDIDIPVHAKIEADVTDFAVPGTYTLATNAPFQGLRDKIDAEDLDVDGLTDELSDAMAQLLDGDKGPMVT